LEISSRVCQCQLADFKSEFEGQLDSSISTRKGHLVRDHERPVDGNSMVGDFDVGLTASTLNQRIFTVDQLLTPVDASPLLSLGWSIPGLPTFCIVSRIPTVKRPVASLHDMAMLGELIQECYGHLGVPVPLQSSVQSRNQ
jgi:hypothetical protein